MASKKNNTKQKESNKGYQPKATARHAKIVKTREEEIEALKKRISNDKYLAKKYESNRRTEIKALPKEERKAAKEELKEHITKRKEAEERDKQKLRKMVHEEKEEKRNLGKEPFDEDAWVKGGKKKEKADKTISAPSVKGSADEPAGEECVVEIEEVQIIYDDGEETIVIEEEMVTVSDSDPEEVVNSGEEEK